MLWDQLQKLRGKKGGTCGEASEEVFQRETEIRLDLSRLPPAKIACEDRRLGWEQRVSKGGVSLGNIKGYNLARKQDANGLGVSNR